MKSHVFSRKSRIEAPVETVFAWHERAGAIERLSPPWDNIRLVSQSNGIQPGSTVRLKISPGGPLPAGPFHLNWTSVHTAYEKNRLFQDIQVKGPFSKWIHTHRFDPSGENACFIEDHIEYALPLHTATAPLFGGSIRSRLEGIFAYRHRTTAADIDCHAGYGMKPMNVMVSGSNGLIASTLIPFLTTGGHRVFRLLRTPPEPEDRDCAYCDLADGVIDLENIENIDAVIHLAGENIGGAPWTRNKKHRILESRTRSTSLLASALAKMKNPPKLFACASAIGYYGNRGVEMLTESAGPGDDFISDVCRKWEAAARPATDAGIRTVFMRIGIVLTPAGGALQKLLPAFQAGLGGPIGDGRQYMSWIGIDDVAGAILHVMADDNIYGPVNLVAPEPITNRAFAETLGRVLSRPAFFRVPETVVNMIFGQMGRETLLSGTRVIPETLSAAGYRFRHPTLHSALSHVLGKTGSIKGL